MQRNAIFSGFRWTKYFIIFLLAAIFFTSCHKKRAVVFRGFYFWKTTFQLSNYEEQRLKDAGCNRIYIRCFDVGWNEATQQPEAIATLRIAQKPSTAFSYIPVVFITQETISKLRPAQVDELSNHMASLLTATCKDLGINPNEIQIDCDWTQRTKDNYFSLLNQLRKTAFFKDKKLSCTIRLHQVKYSLRSGIPPVDRGLIMCYNIGNLKQPGAHNSILDASLAKDYLQNLRSYPLAVDIALPLYSWCLHFREGKLQGILRDVSPESVIHDPLFQLKKKKPLYLRAGFQLAWLSSFKK